jgi:hypothetical protein
VNVNGSESCPSVRFDISGVTSLGFVAKKVRPRNYWLRVVVRVYDAISIGEVIVRGISDLRRMDRKRQ